MSFIWYTVYCIVLRMFRISYDYLIVAWWRHMATKRSGSTLALVMACCLTAPSRHLNQCWQIISESSDIHIRALSQEKPQPSITKICLKITYLKFHSSFPVANELSYTWAESAFGKGRHWLRWWFGWSGNRPPHEPNVIWILNAILWHQTNMKLTGSL